MTTKEVIQCESLPPGEPPNVVLRTTDDSPSHPVTKRTGAAFWTVVLPATAIVAAFLWSYWPTLVDLIRLWNREPDYSHGFLVAPFALLLLWLRRDVCPGASGRLAWWGLSAIIASMALRYAGARYFVSSADAWSMTPWIAGTVWFFAGPRVCLWSLPAVAFLLFMVPLPFRAEHALSFPLQTVATRASCWVLQACGQKAIPMGHTILLGTVRWEVEQACSGLRVFMGIGALGVAYCMAIRQSLWQKVAILASVVPVALIANVVRVVATVLLYRYASDEAARKFSHDTAGWAMILLAAALFALMAFYLHCLVRKVEIDDAGRLLRRVYGTSPRDALAPQEAADGGRVPGRAPSA